MKRRSFLGGLVAALTLGRVKMAPPPTTGVSSPWSGHRRGPEDGSYSWYTIENHLPPGSRVMIGQDFEVPEPTP